MFAPSLMAMIAFWATLSLNMPDFTRFASSQRRQTWGQIVGLPTSMSFIAILSIVITSSAVEVYGDALGENVNDLFNPVNLINQFDSTFAVLGGVIVVIIATVSTNLAANVVSPSYDFSNALPKRISFRTGGLITGVIGIVIMPWKLISDPSIYIFAWLGFYGGVLAAVAGVLIAGYWVQYRDPARPRRPLRETRPVLVQRRLELAGRWSPRSLGAVDRGRRRLRRAVPGRRPDPVPAGLLRLQLGRGPGRGFRGLLGAVDHAPEPGGRSGARAKEGEVSV